MNTLMWKGLFLCLALILAPALRAEWYQDQAAIMGSNISAKLWAESPEAGQKALAMVMAEMRRIDALMSPYIDSSELAMMNRRAVNEVVVVTPEMYGLLKRAQQISELSGGAFDITFASAGFLYDYRRKVHPDEEALRTVLPAISYRHVVLNDADRSVHFTQKHVRIDLGGIAKGHAVDSCIALLKTLGIRHASVTAGGDTRLLGDKHGEPWVVGIRHPRDKNKLALLMPMDETAFSTSGDYERFFVEDGVRYHHIINPGTGKPATGIVSVTILAGDATTTDGLSTTIFVMGTEKGMQLIEKLPDVEAVIIDDKGIVHYSSGLTPPEIQSGT